jgi:nucleoside 2-deoxyribosyltransferase
MKVYLAAPYSWKDQMNVFAKELREHGIVVTSRWLEEPHSEQAGQTVELNNEWRRFYARQDVEDVRAADLLVFFTDPTKRIVRGGRHVEFGIAIEREMPIYVLGDQENIFHHLPNVWHCQNWEQIKSAILIVDSILHREIND